MRVKTYTLIGKSLDWAVAKATWSRPPSSALKFLGNYNPSTSLEQGYAVILGNKVSVVYDKWFDEWDAYITTPGVGGFTHKDPLVAAMRAVVWYHLGNEVDVPDQIVEDLQ